MLFAKLRLFNQGEQDLFNQLHEVMTVHHVFTQVLPLPWLFQPAVATVAMAFGVAVVLLEISEKN